MKSLFVFALLAISAAPSAFAEKQALLICKMGGGGKVSVIATESKGKVDLAFDEEGKSRMGGLSEVRSLPGTLESASSENTAGPIDMVEIGSYSSSQSACGLGLLLNAKNQRLGRDRDIALTPSSTYNEVECRGQKAEIESCALGDGLHSANDLKKFIRIEVAD